MHSLEDILTSMYEDINSKGAFIPLCIANMLICYKLAHDDLVYWANFKRKTQDQEILNVKDMYMFFIDFLPTTSLGGDSHIKKIEYLKSFDGFLSELFISQKKYAKASNLFEKHLEKACGSHANKKLSKHTMEIYELVKKIRFPEL